MRNLSNAVDSRHVEATDHATHAFVASDWLHLAATPTFAAMALLTALTEVPADILCPAGHGMSSLGGMTLMYALMGAFHAAPWLKLIARWSTGRDDSRARTP